MLLISLTVLSEKLMRTARFLPKRWHAIALWQVEAKTRKKGPNCAEESRRDSQKKKESGSTCQNAFIKYGEDEKGDDNEKINNGDHM